MTNLSTVVAIVFSNTLIFLLQKCEQLLQCESFSHFFQQIKAPQAKYPASLMKIHQQLLKILSINENTGMSRADNSVKNWWNLPISNPKPDIHNINAHTKFGENPLKFTQVIVRKQKYGWTDIRQTDRHTDNQSETIIPSHYPVGVYKSINIFAIFQDRNFYVRLANNFIKFWRTGPRLHRPEGWSEFLLGQYQKVHFLTL